VIGRIAYVEVPDRRGWTMSKAALYLGMCRMTLRNLTDLGQIRCKWDPNLNRRLYLLEELDRYLEGAPDYNPSHGENPVERSHDGS